MKSSNILVSPARCPSRPARALWIEICRSGPSARYPPSRPARALWIEIDITGRRVSAGGCRGPRGPCGLKYLLGPICYKLLRRGPRGPCGLKCLRNLRNLRLLLSRPARALWIEIETRFSCSSNLASRPARALWIEIFLVPGEEPGWKVEAREGLVD